MQDRATGAAASSANGLRAAALGRTAHLLEKPT
jgi:hypothetical protein